MREAAGGGVFPCVGGVEEELLLDESWKKYTITLFEQCFKVLCKNNSIISLNIFILHL